MVVTGGCYHIMCSLLSVRGSPGPVVTHWTDDCQVVRSRTSRSPNMCREQITPHLIKKRLKLTISFCLFIYLGQVTKLRLSCYLVLLSIVLWPDPSINLFYIYLYLFAPHSSASFQEKERARQVKAEIREVSQLERWRPATPLLSSVPPAAIQEDSGAPSSLVSRA